MSAKREVMRKSRTGVAKVQTQGASFSKGLILLMLVGASVSVRAQYFDNETRRAIEEEERIRHYARENINRPNPFANCRGDRDPLGRPRSNQGRDSAVVNLTDEQRQKFKQLLEACQVVGLKMIAEKDGEKKHAEEIKYIASIVTIAQQALVDNYISLENYQKGIEAAVTLMKIEERQKSESAAAVNLGETYVQQTQASRMPESSSPEGASARDGNEHSRADGNSTRKSGLVVIVALAVGWFMIRSFVVQIKRALADEQDGSIGKTKG